ncbi:Fumarate reductase flavoprotein subunit [Gammaproteobacteria bacterium]
MKVIYSDVLIIGGGLAGLRTAIGVKRRGLSPIVLSLVPVKRSHSVAAQGGMQASLGNGAWSIHDNEDRHFEDTVRGSDWGCDQLVARLFTHLAPKAVRELAAWGVPWNRIQAGRRETVKDGAQQSFTEPRAAHGLIDARDFGGTQTWRTCYTSDGTGHTMLYTLGDRAVAEEISIHERKEALTLIHDQQRCYGAVVRDLVTGELIAYVAHATLIATGGYGRLYGISTNALINEGMGAALALETGVAELANMEAVQFHPTAIVPAAILVTEGCRGDGGLLRDAAGHRFMPDYEPEKKELASRDVVARRMAEHIRRGQGVASPYGDHLWLDITVLGAAHINHNLREVQEICRYFLGIDPARNWIPVRPTQHYSMGGIRTNYQGASPTLTGLFACGEAACWDLHGFNRLGGNSVAETVVAGMLISEYIADFCASSAGEMICSTGLVREALQSEQAHLDTLLDNRHSGSEDAVAIRQRMETILMNTAGLFRSGPELEQAVGELQQLLHRAQQVRVRTRGHAANPELIAAYRLPRMIKLALTIALGALTRTESRGAHYREDYPTRNDRDWLCRTLAVWKDPTADLPELHYEPLTVDTMELPPGFRGYGARNLIEHPDAARRQTEVEALHTRITDPARRQTALLPYLNLLPERYRGPNQRLDHRVAPEARP